MASHFKIGDELGSFELRRPLGRGAFGEVWLAIDSGELDFIKQVAVKIFPFYSTRSNDHYESLLNEARLVGHLKHPNVVDVYRAGIDGDHAWIAMEYLAGRTLSEVLEHAEFRGLWIPRSVVVDMAVYLAEALHYAHTARDHDGDQLGIIHRDLKLANVMVSPEFGLKVLDFGIAKAVTNVSETVTDVMKGTPAYMAPEVWRLEGTTPRSDLFSLGVILYRLALSRKFTSGVGLPGIRKRIVDGRAAVDAAEVGERVPELEEVVQGLLERDVEQRTPTAREALKQLHRVQRAMHRPAGLRDFLQLLEATFPQSDVVDDAWTDVWAGGPDTSRSAWSSLLASDDDDWLRLYGEANGEPAAGEATVAGSRGRAPIDREAETELRPSMAAVPVGSPAAQDDAEASVSMPTIPPPAPRTMPWVALVLALAVALVTLVVRPWADPAPIAALGPATDIDVAPAEPEADPAPDATDPDGPVDDPAAVSGDPVKEPASPRAANPPPAAASDPTAPDPVPPPRGEPPAPDPTPEPTPPPVAAVLPGCVEFESDPVGASIWFDGAPLTARAGARNLPRSEAPGGRHRVEMGLAGGARVGVDLVVQDGARHRVICSFSGAAPNCRSMGPLGSCR